METLKKELASNKDRDEEQSLVEESAIFWATFDERAGEVRAHYESNSPLKSLRIEANYHALRDTDQSLQGKDEIKTLKEIAEQFSDSKAWERQQADEGLLIVRLVEDGLKTPEWIRLRLNFDDGRSITAPIVISKPRFQSRDSDTGIPKELSSISDLLGHAPPIVRPVGPINIEADEVEDDEMDNPEDQQQSLVQLGSLAESPEYNHLPDSIKVIKRLQRAGMGDSPEYLARDFVGIAKKSRSSRQRLLAKALLEVIRGKK